MLQDICQSACVAPAFLPRIPASPATCTSWLDKYSALVGLWSGPENHSKCIASLLVNSLVVLVPSGEHQLQGISCSAKQDLSGLSQSKNVLVQGICCTLVCHLDGATVCHMQSSFTLLHKQCSGSVGTQRSALEVLLGSVGFCVPRCGHNMANSVFLGHSAG